jgi:hypothetical protein
MSNTYRTHDLSRLSVADLRSFVGNRWSRKLAHNTFVEQLPHADLAIRFHATRILRFHMDGSFTVNSGGYQTVTTKQRLNALLPAGYRIFAQRYVWKIDTPEGTFEFCDGDRWGQPAPVAEGKGHCSCSCHPYREQHGPATSACTGCGCPGWRASNCTTLHGSYLRCGPTCYVAAPALQGA